MIRDEVRLREVLGHPDLVWLVQRARRRLLDGRVDGMVTLAAATPAQREAIDRLFGRRASRGGSLTVRIADVEVLLREAGICDSLREGVEALSGTLIDVRAQRQATDALWAALFEDDGGRLPPWTEDLRATGLLRRLARNDLAVARRLLRQARDVEQRLPAGGLPLAELAAAVTGDSHALDRGTPLGTIAVRVAASIGRLGGWGGAEARREAWTSVGVLCDELSAPVLILNLRGDSSSVTDRALALHAAVGEPYRLTTRQLLREPPSFTRSMGGRTVYVCENPTVVAAAANRLGAAGAPLVCIEGQPKTAARIVLNLLTAAGVHLAYHGDFDWTGIQIGNLLMRRHAVVPWRFSTVDYRAARGGRLLQGDPVGAVWDADLATAMTAARRAVHEEEVLELLVRDLATTA